MKRVVVTGAGGYVGGALVAGLRKMEIPVIEFRRTAATGESWVQAFRLGETPPPGSFDEVETLVHCAYDFSAHGWDAIAAVNVEGTRRLFAAAAEAGVKRLILVSTISAYPGCRSLYGKAKLAMEAAVAPYRTVVVRPGLVFGDRPGGMMAALNKLVSLPGIVPMVGDGHYPLYLAHEDDLRRLLILLATRSSGLEGQPFVAAYERPYTLREIMVALARVRNRQVRFLPVPAGLIDLGLNLVESVGLRPRLRRDSLVSLLNPDPSPDFAPLTGLGIGFRPFLPSVD